MAPSDGWQPDILVLANGFAVNGVVDIEVCNDSFLGADRYKISFALGVSGYDAFVGNAIEIDINIGLNGSWQSMIKGPVDRVEVDLGAGLIHVDGRDLTARFIEARTQETFENWTASEIAELFAGRHNLLANVSPTTTLIGRSFGGDHSRVTLDQYSGMTTEWDVLVRLASFEGFDVWVDGQTLNFAPPVRDMSPIRLTPQDCQSVRLDRCLALSGGLEVTVKSWDCRDQIAVSQIASSATSGSGGSSYVLVKPNLTASAASDLASRVLSQMSQNGRVVTLDLPGELTLLPRQTLMLQGTNTDFDGSYVITQVERRLSSLRGFTETLQARVPSWTTS